MLLCWLLPGFLGFEHTQNSTKIPIQTCYYGIGQVDKKKICRLFRSRVRLRDQWYSEDLSQDVGDNVSISDA